MEKSNGSTEPGENSEEIVQDILGEVVGDIPSHNQLDGMAEEHEAEPVTNEVSEETTPEGPKAPAPEVSNAPEAVQEPRPSISKEASAESSTDSTSEMDRRLKNHKIDLGQERNMKARINKYEFQKLQKITNMNSKHQQI